MGIRSFKNSEYSEVYCMKLSVMGCHKSVHWLLRLSRAYSEHVFIHILAQELRAEMPKLLFKNV